MRFILLLLNEHRLLFVWVLALVLWITAYGIYFRNIIRRQFNKGRPHNWSIDLVRKKAITNGKEEVY